MSKQKHPNPSTPAECVPATQKLPLGECLGKTVTCPSCGKPAEVGPARGAMLRNQPISSKFWVRLACTGCGARLEQIGKIVDVAVEPKPPPEKRPVGHVVSHFVKCPVPDCGAVSRVTWTVDDGHIVDCPVHQRRMVSPETEVELVA